MSEYSTGTLKTLVGKIKQAAIDAFMCEETWGGSDGVGISGWTIQGDLYFYVHPTSGSFGPITEEVTRPGADGEGGGRWKMRVPMAPDPDEEDRYVDDFDSIRRRIDEVFEPWFTREIPDPDAFDAPIGHLQAAIADLTLNSDGEEFSAGDIRALIRTQLHRINGGDYTGWSGKTVRAFENSYGEVRCATVTQNQRALLTRLAQALCAEQQIWFEARPAIMTIADGALAAFNAVAKDGDTESAALAWKIVSGVTGIIADAVPGGKVISKTISAAAVAMDVAKLFGTPEPPSEQKPGPISGGSFEAVMSSLEEAERALGLDIYEAEYYVWETLKKATDLASRDDRIDDFHIHRGRGIRERDDQTGTDWSEPNSLAFNADLFEEIGRYTLPSLGAILVGSADEAALSKASVWERDYRVGWGTRGAQSGYESSLDWAVQLMRSSGRDLVEAGEHCMIAAGYIRTADEETDRAFRAQYDKLDVGVTDYAGDTALPAPDPDEGTLAGPGAPGDPYHVPPRPGGPRGRPIPY
ncbi:hypothetical protein JK386_12470 [Nocardioides sp. zg-536]|uniref:Uncharacterized protein n=1 Tax=Nocardioides faecalis TaxID=2803858 RepID=A0A939BZ68_9ACTN|nr:hypothetical protein [Nocardioides faecalis]MBM9460720.1 hypothetical protein [Nocardioides faecalis]QVI57923.1 hypothetical protein KG111_12845 [Nocardioides faecalis]